MYQIFPGSMSPCFFPPGCEARLYGRQDACRYGERHFQSHTPPGCRALVRAFSKWVRLAKNEFHGAAIQATATASGAGTASPRRIRCKRSSCAIARNICRSSLVSYR